MSDNSSGPNPQIPPIQMPIIDLGGLKKSPQQQEPKTPVAMVATIIFSDGTSQQMSLLAGSNAGLQINIGNVRQPGQGLS